ncbi:peptidylprolyl isomerase [Mesorhizobium microcysteis]|jgi:peptidylprolyl isomerase|uniref:Peptidyl-prolyl cis-trans isomerase n=1 Tax=Neoaquamicrobium microcysteis TaxID=2682781 RepID=A0A5D4H4Q1_9HYPH|nr:peptidylprolyl isomerase [Mesorhizobium microcysteis]TYR35233.1 peptidylprolyl isomerase [Mesorhizobium microcysteis]
MQFLRFASSIVVAAGLMAGSALAAEPENTMIIELKDGEVSIALRPDLAPKHVEQIKALVRGGEYNNVAFHRVIDGFMAQTGDVEFGDLEDGYNSQRVGTGGSSLGNVGAEFSSEQFVRGTVGMARAQNPDSANSQFFIMFAPAPSLDGSYTVIGTVESGMELVDNIKRGNQAQNGVVTDPDRMISVRIAAD